MDLFDKLFLIMAWKFQIIINIAEQLRNMGFQKLHSEHHHHHGVG